MLCLVQSEEQCSRGCACMKKAQRTRGGRYHVPSAGGELLAILQHEYGFLIRSHPISNVIASPCCAFSLHSNFLSLASSHYVCILFVPAVGPTFVLVDPLVVVGMYAFAQRRLTIYRLAVPQILLQLLRHAGWVCSSGYTT